MIFYLGSSEGWNIALYYLDKASSIWSTLYYLPIMFIGVVMLQSMNVAIIRYEFSKVKHRAPREEEAESDLEADPAWQIEALRELPGEVFRERISRLRGGRGHPHPALRGRHRLRGHLGLGLPGPRPGRPRPHPQKGFRPHQAHQKRSQDDRPLERTRQRARHIHWRYQLGPAYHRLWGAQGVI